MTEPVDELRRAFLDFFVERRHIEVPSASLQPHDPTLLFTVAGMVPFKPYFVGDEEPPFPRAASCQKCVRAGGKHNDLDDIGRTNRHFSFFEMLGNFSFGDYFKRDAIRYAWEFVTETLGLSVDRLWVTVHISDDEAAQIWREIGIAEERIQRLDADNFWQMADTGPCGPSSEIFWDLGPEFGADGGPAHGGVDRFIEIWNLVFMQYEQRGDGSRIELPKPSIDTGAGLERLLLAIEGAPSIWETSLFRPLIGVAERLTGIAYGAASDSDVSLRILAEHGRTMTFLISDGVVPSNEDRGYVLRRIIRRAVLHGFRLGVETILTPLLVDATVEAMGEAYPELGSRHRRIRDAVAREEERFRSTLARGLDRLADIFDRGNVSGPDAFFLHDTLGFPIDLTRELAEERSLTVDLEGFDREMTKQRERARSAQASSDSGQTAGELLREIQSRGPSEFVGRDRNSIEDAGILAIVRDGAEVTNLPAGGEADVFLDRTPFYAESGGQLGDSGSLRWEGGNADVLDTQYAIPGALIRQRVRVVEGTLRTGLVVAAAIDRARRDAIRKHHTATHLLHWALREVLGEHVAQAGSMVGPDRLRFDFSHHEGVSRADLDRIEDLVNTEILTDAAVTHTEMDKSAATDLGAIAFFGDKYGDRVRVLQAGPHSIELCGGTHVSALGSIGLVRVLSEGSVGANTRRIEAVAGTAAHAAIREEGLLVRDLEHVLKVRAPELHDRIEKLASRTKALEAELASLRMKAAEETGASLAERASGGAVVRRIDGFSPEIARRVVSSAREALTSGIVAIVGVGTTPESAVVAVAVTDDLVATGVSAAAIAAPAAKLIRGGTARANDVVAGGGKDPNGIPAALDALTATIEEATSGHARGRNDS
ncbi:MAG: alanine--tRNA ligase [Acidimicrobiia bacterium]